MMCPLQRPSTPRRGEGSLRQAIGHGGMGSICEGPEQGWGGLWDRPGSNLLGRRKADSTKGIIAVVR